MLTHLAVIPRQAMAIGADGIWPPGTCLQAGCLGLCDLCVGDKASSLAKKILKMGQGKIELYLVSLNAKPLLCRADDILPLQPMSHLTLGLHGSIQHLFTSIH